jgi:hypothetical protein
MTDGERGPNPFPGKIRRGSNVAPRDGKRPVGNDNHGDARSASGVQQQSNASELSNEHKAEFESMSKAELEELAHQVKRQRERPQAPKVRVTSASRELKLPSVADEVRYRSAFGTGDVDFANLMHSGLINATCEVDAEGRPSERGINKVLAAVTGVGAKDEVEGMLATQMVATHSAAITALARLKDTDHLLTHDSYGNLAIKLLRTYTAQMEALHRYRGKAEPAVTVGQVNVNSGGQAIVGSITNETKKPEAQSSAPPAITHEPGIPMRSPDPEREAVPVPRGSREAALPHARRR